MTRPGSCPCGPRTAKRAKRRENVLDSVLCAKNRMRKYIFANGNCLIDGQLRGKAKAKEGVNRLHPLRAKSNYATDRSRISRKRLSRAKASGLRAKRTREKRTRVRPKKRRAGAAPATPRSALRDNRDPPIGAPRQSDRRYHSAGPRKLCSCGDAVQKRFVRSK